MWISKVHIAGGSLRATIPAPLCKELKIERGDVVMYLHTKRDEITLVKMTPAKLEALRTPHGENIGTIV